jgi:hypothetical protein
MKTEKCSFVTCVKIKIITEYMRLRRMQHSGTHCVAFFGTRGRQGIRHPRSIQGDPKKKRRVHSSLIYRTILIIYTPN